MLPIRTHLRLVFLGDEHAIQAYARTRHMITSARIRHLQQRLAKLERQRNDMAMIARVDADGCYPAA